ncbi:MAG: hypothetical protein K0Q84_1846 [Arthrobacter sp.]|nr:hypothetical protein [Arthrobacter sp.]
MHAFLPRHFRVEGGSQQPAGTHSNNSSCPLQIGSVGSVDRVRRLHLGEHLDAVAHPLHPRAADEDCMHGRHAFLRGTEVQSLEVEVCLERLALAAERVAPNGDVEAAEGLLGIAGKVSGGISYVVRQQNHAGTGPVNRQALGNVLAQRVRQLECARKLVDGRGFPAGNNEAVKVVQFSRATDADGGGTCCFDGMEVLTEVALECKDADAKS